jgi:beta-glucosidase/6-phospho-beta-glucosidase/beta-galactosidase
MNFHFYFSEKFGLFHVDFNDPERKRTAKKSAEVYSQIIKRNKIPAELLSVVDSQ